MVQNRRNSDDLIDAAIGKTVTKTGWSLGGIGLLAAVAAIALVAWDGYYTVDAQDAAIIKQWGAFDGVTFEGLHGKVPFAQSITHVSLAQQTDVYPAMEAYTADQQTATITVGVQWRQKGDPKSVEVLARQYGGSLAVVKAKLIDSNLPAFLKIITGKYTAVSAVQDRGKFNSDVAQAMQDSVGPDSPITIERVNIQDIKYDPKYEAAIQQRNDAEVAVRTREQALRQAAVDASIVEQQAKGLAAAVVAKANGDRDAAIAAGVGKATAIKAVSDALNAAGPLYIENRRIEQWRGEVPTTMLPNATIPFVNLTPPVAAAKN